VPAPARASGKASGTPLVFGQVNSEGGPIASWPEMRQASLAAVQYVNNELNGIGGHPMNLQTCVTDGTPAGSTKCANQLVEQKPVAMLGGADLGTTGSVPIYNNAQLPLIGPANVGTADQQYARAFMFSGFAPGVFSAIAVYVTQTLKAQKVTFLAGDSPTIHYITDFIMAPILKKNGVTDFRQVLTPPGNTSDWATRLTAAMASKPDALVIVPSDTGDCTANMQARQSLGLQTQVKYVLAGVCLDNKVVQAAGAGAEGVYMNFSTLPPFETNDPDVALYLAKLKQYGSANLTLDEFAGAGFQTVMNAYDVLNKLGPDNLSSDKIVAAFKATQNQHNFMGKPYTCDGKQVPTVPAMCNAAQRMVQVQNGKFVDVGGGWINGAQFITPPSGPPPSGAAAAGGAPAGAPASGGAPSGGASGAASGRASSSAAASGGASSGGAASGAASAKPSAS